MQMKYEKVLQCEEENINRFFHRPAIVTSCGLNVLGSQSTLNNRDPVLIIGCDLFKRLEWAQIKQLYH